MTAGGGGQAEGWGQAHRAKVTSKLHLKGEGTGQERIRGVRGVSQATAP